MARAKPQGERLAVTEALLHEHVAQDALAFDRLTKSVAETHILVQRIEQRLSKQTGFTAGVATVVSVAWAVILFAAAYWPLGK